MLNSWCVSIRIYWLVFCQITLWLFVLQHVDSLSLLRVWSRERNRVTARSDQPGLVCHTALTCKSLSLCRSYCVIYWCSGFIDYLCQVGAVCFTLCLRRCGSVHEVQTEAVMQVIVRWWWNRCWTACTETEVYPLISYFCKPQKNYLKTSLAVQNKQIQSCCWNIWSAASFRKVTVWFL